MLKATGRITVKSGGRSVTWVWDYANDKPMVESEMTKEGKKASERVKWERVAEEIKRETEEQ